MMHLVKLTVCFSLFIAMASCSGNAKEKNEDVGKRKKSTPKKERHANVRYMEDEDKMAVILCQGWENEDDVQALEGMDQLSDFDIASRSFYLSPDGSFTSNVRNTMDYGKWTFDDASKMISFAYYGGGKDIYKIKALAADELQLKNAELNTVTVLKFVSTGKAFKNEKEEPFHISNNQWRIAPSKPETDLQIAARLKDNLHFFILFYKDAIAKEPAFISFYGLPSCLKWYAGGIYLRKPEELDSRWRSCFYDEAQSMKAYKLMDKVLDKKYDWPKDEANWLKKNLYVLEQMYRQIDSASINY